jgi:hypothetical protein
LLLAPPSWAVESQAPLLRVGITEVPPFVIQEESGNWRGISIDLWTDIAEKAGYRYELQPLPFEQLLPALEAGTLDVVVGALTMTAEREERFDFTHPFYQTGLAIAVPRGGDGSGWNTVKGLLSWQFVSLVLGLAALMLIVGAVLWMFERRHNREQFGGTPAQGLGSSFWWAAVTMTTVGYGDKAPVTLGGRLIALVWMFAGLIMVSTFTAAVASALTVGNLQSFIHAYTRSMTVAGPMPPPTHRLTSAVARLLRSSSSSTVPRIIAPVAPSGCPSAIAPPLTLIRL